MKIKRFEGRNVAEAMIGVKKDFGKDAVIVSTENIGGKVIVTAARDYDLEEGGTPFKSRGAYGYTNKTATYGRTDSRGLQESSFKGISPTVAEVPREVDSFTDLNNSIEFASLKEQLKEQQIRSRQQESKFLNELAMLRESLEALLKNSVSKLSEHAFHLMPYIKKGIKAGIDETAMEKILKETKLPDNSFMTDSELELFMTDLFSSKIEVTDVFNIMDKEGGIYLFVGPTGVGKTTTLIKIAAKLILERNRNDIAIISLDFMRADAGSQIKKFTDILNLPFFHFRTADEYFANIEDIRINYKTVLIDTAGVSHKSQSSMQFLEKIASAVYTCPILHIPVATEYEQALSVINRFETVLGEMLVVYTKEDEAIRNGLMGSLAGKTSVSPCFVTNGQKIPEDIVRLKSSSQLSDMIFKNEIC